MRIVHTLPELRQQLASAQHPAFVPTMGNLHAGHIALITQAKPLGDCTVVALDDDVPALGTFDPTQCHLRWDVVLTTEKPRSEIEDVFMFVIDDMELDITAIHDGASAMRLGEILVERGDVDPAVINKALAEQEPLGKLLVKTGQVSEDQVLSALAEQGHVRGEAEKLKSGAKDQATIRVAAERLDGLMDRVGELVIAQARLKQLAGSLGDGSLKSVAEEIERLTADREAARAADEALKALPPPPLEPPPGAAPGR